MKIVSKETREFMRANLTKTQYNYWYAYYVLDKTLAEISIDYDVHISTVCHVLKNARKRLNSIYGKECIENACN